MALAEWERTTDTSTKQFAEFIGLLAKNNLLDDALRHLESKGLDKIRVSVQHIRELQDFLRKHYQSKGGLPAAAQATVLSAHVDGYCK